MEGAEMIEKKGTVGVGYVELDPGLAYDVGIFQLYMTASAPCRVRLGESGGPWASPDIYLALGVPFILMSSEGPWITFPAGTQIGIEVAAASGSPQVGAHAFLGRV
jgi:hypothetical protein